MAINLADCAACYGTRLELENQIENLGSFRKLSVRPLKYLKEARTSFVDTPKFEEQLEFLKEKSNNYIAQMGEAAQYPDTNFIRDLKNSYKRTPLMQRNKFLNKALNLKIPSDIDQMKTVSGSYAGAMMMPIFISVVEKLAMDFNNPTFVCGINAAIIEYNALIGEVKDTHQYALETLTFLKVEECYGQKYINTWFTRINSALEGGGLTEDADMNYAVLYEGLTEEQIEKVNKVRVACKIVLNTTWTEIKIKTGLNKMFVVNAYTGLS